MSRISSKGLYKGHAFKFVLLYFTEIVKKKRYLACGAGGKVGDHHRQVSSRVEYKCRGNQVMVVEIFQSEPKWLTFQQTLPSIKPQYCVSYLRLSNVMNIVTKKDS